MNTISFSNPWMSLYLKTKTGITKVKSVRVSEQFISYDLPDNLQVGLSFGMFDVLIEKDGEIQPIPIQSEEQHPPLFIRTNAKYFQVTGVFINELSMNRHLSNEFNDGFIASCDRGYSYSARLFESALA
jgi:hypothetical protein